MDIFSICILLLAGLFLWWVIKERGRNERERQVSVELVNRLFRLDERLLKLEVSVEQLQSAGSSLAPAAAVGQTAEVINQKQPYPESMITSLPVSGLADIRSSHIGQPPQPTNGKPIGTSLAPVAGVKKAALPLPKREEMGMAALVCGIALFMSDEHRSKDKPDQK